MDVTNPLASTQVDLSCVCTAYGLPQDQNLMCWVGSMGKGRVQAGQFPQVLASPSVEEF